MFSGVFLEFKVIKDEMEENYTVRIFLFLILTHIFNLIQKSTNDRSSTLLSIISRLLHQVEVLHWNSMWIWWKQHVLSLKISIKATHLALLHPEFSCLWKGIADNFPERQGSTQNSVISNHLLCGHLSTGLKYSSSEDSCVWLHDMDFPFSHSPKLLS